MMSTSARGLLASLTMAALLGVSSAAAAQSEGDAPRKNDRAADRERKASEREQAKRLEKLDPADRAALDAAIGYVAPEFTAGLDWLGNPAPSMQSLRGKVVVIQTFTTRTASFRTLPERVAKALAEHAGQVQVIAIHTPEGMDKAENFLKRAELAAPTAIDRDGAFCDAIGAYKRPVNLVVDKTGDVRFAGLTIDGLTSVVAELAAQEFDPANKPTERPHQTVSTGKEFPTFTSPVRSASDLRGKPSPRLPNVKWEYDAPPRLSGQLVVVDFWATWCGPCRQAIPHMNELAKAFGSDVVFLGISDESPSNFEKGLKDRNLKRSSFDYPVGIDPTGSMKKAFGVSGIPHCAIISSDGIVRWQGHPMELDNQVLRQLVDANRSLNDRSGGVGGASRRWQSDMERESGKQERRPRR